MTTPRCGRTGCDGPGIYRAAVDGWLYCPVHFEEEVGRYEGALAPDLSRCDVCGERGELMRATTYGERLVRCSDHVPCGACSRTPTVQVVLKSGSDVYLCARHRYQMRGSIL